MAKWLEAREKPYFTPEAPSPFQSAGSPAGAISLTPWASARRSHVAIDP